MPPADRRIYVAAQTTAWTARSGAALSDGKTAWAAVSTSADALVQVASSAPSDDSEAWFLGDNQAHYFSVAAGDQVWVRSRTGTVHLSVAVWILESS